MKYYSVTDHTSFLLAFIGMVGLLSFGGCRTRRMSEAEASDAFRKYVLSPIPESVTNIRGDQPKNFGGYRYTFRFNIDKDDLKLLTGSGPFVRVWNVKYGKDGGGRLSWGWDRGSDDTLGFPKYNSGMPCYDNTHEPDWLRPGQWDNPEAYAFWKEGDAVNIEIFDKNSSGPTSIRVLLYNENEAEAYFVVHYSEK